jgi:hypothetical protein
MAVLVFRLNGVGDDEAQAVRELLNAADIAFYETDAGRWGVSVAAIWLPDEEHFARARALIDDYQQRRSEQLERRYHGVAGFVRSIISQLLQAPLATLAIWILIAAVAYVSIAPFLL